MAIGPLANEDGAPPVASLRTIKSDVVVGVDKQVADRLDEQEPGWRISGKYAVVLLSEGRKGVRSDLTASRSRSGFVCTLLVLSLRSKHDETKKFARFYAVFAPSTPLIMNMVASAFILSGHEP